MNLYFGVLLWIAPYTKRQQHLVFVRLACHTILCSDTDGFAKIGYSGMHSFISPVLDQADWDHLRVFLTAARSGSFRSASTVLRMTQPTVGRRVEALEERLGVKLFKRLPNGVKLTEVGDQLLQLACKIERLVREVDLRGAAESSLAGYIRLRATDGIGGYWLPVRLTEFHEKYPEITVEVICTDQPPDLSNLDSDIAVTYEEPRNSDIVILSENKVVFRPFASVEYFERHGQINTLEDLADHHICDHTGYPVDNEWGIWADAVKRSGKISYRTNSSLALGFATLHGLGVSMLPMGVSNREPKLTMLDLGGYAPSLTFWLVCHRDNKDIPRIRALIDHLRSVLFNRPLPDARKTRP